MVSVIKGYAETININRDTEVERQMDISERGRTSREEERTF
jgi:hypothetical protein